MYFKNVGELMRETQSLNSLHKPIKSYKYETFYCNEKSVGMNEFYQSATNGFKPEIKLEAKLIDLSGVTHIRYNNKVYEIVRTYKKEDLIEIVLTSVLHNE